MNIHEKYIKRCIEIAKNGLGITRPNPMVGSVIVYKDHIIGEGYTSAYGGNHAEVNAIASVKDKDLLLKSTLYVTLEPCSHYGKTPPCSDLIIKHHIPNVYIGCTDASDKVSGKGIEKLKKAGIHVEVGILENECKMLHKRFLTFHQNKRPYIILKWAQTQNGFIAPKQRNEIAPVWISNSYSRQLVHKWRTEEQAILVGANTVLMDDPSLTARDWAGQNPIRLLIDKTNKLPSNLRIFSLEAKTIRITSASPQDICDYLFEENITSLIVEGGLNTLKQFIKTNFWDEARVFIGPSNFEEGVPAPNLKGTLISQSEIQSDILKIYVND